jgi:pimeloyl-ACP methyl ester carboxylesterase
MLTGNNCNSVLAIYNQMRRNMKAERFTLLCLIALSCISSLSADNTTSSANGVEGPQKITLGGIDQWISIQGNDFSKPVLLVMHGGPGYAMMSLFHENNRELEDHFVVVNWDQRGAGRSYSSDIPRQTMTLKQFILDAHDLTAYLKNRFDRDKIFLIGHSFGTLIGTILIQDYPDDYFALCNVGQVVNVVENEQLSYGFALEQALAHDKKKAIRELKYVGAPDDQGAYADDSGYEITMKWVGYYGGELYGEKDSGEIEDQILNSDIYENYQEEIISGWSFSQELFNDEAVWDIDLREDITHVEVPVFFFMGRFDYDTPFPLVEQYYNVLQAPRKEIIWFDKSAHFPFYEEPDKFNEMLIDRFVNSSKE